MLLYRLLVKLTSCEGFACVLKASSVIYHPEFLSYVDRNIFLAACASFIDFQVSLSYSYGDTFLMLVGLAMAAKFEGLARRAERLAEKRVKDELAWMQLREDYNMLSSFCAKLDDALGYLVLVAFVNNFYAVLIEMSSSLLYGSLPDFRL